MRKVAAIIAAAGEGRRIGFQKQFALLKGRPVLDWVLERFEAHPRVAEVVLVMPDETRERDYLNRFKKIVQVVRGGERRQDSVLAGFSCLRPEQAGIVLVHDGVRPLVSPELIDRVLRAAEQKGAAVPALPVEDTVKLVEAEVVSRTLERGKLFRTQTPQGFLFQILAEALEMARRENYTGTDEASLVERTGRQVAIVPGDPRNIKITTAEDLRIAEAFLED